MLLHKVCNSYLDRLIRPEIQLFRRSWPSFQFCGYVGLGLAIILATILVRHQGLSLLVMGGLALSAMATFLTLAMITKIITDEEKLVYYHQEVAVLVVVALLLWLLRQPILPYLDVAILGVGLFLACGRVGCLMVGCCHGRPYRWGVCYRDEHAVAGFTPYFVGVRLFPIQAVESAWVFGTVMVGSAFILNNYPPGEALAWYVITYDIGRFGFEFLRGDPARPYRWGFSEAQWTSLLLMGAIVGGELVRGLPFHLWHAGVTVGLTMTVIGVALGRRYDRTAKHKLLHPQHIKEVAEAVQQLCHVTAGNIMSNQNSGTQILPVASTSLGLTISASKLKNETGHIHHFALSSKDGVMSEEAVRLLADVILKLRYPTGWAEIIQGNQSVFHVLIHSSNQNNGHQSIQPETLPHLPEHLLDLRQEVIDGLLYTHSRLNANTSQVFDARLQLTTLIDLLNEKGLITIEELEKPRAFTEQRLVNEFQEQGMGVMVQDPAADKYSFTEEVKIDCASRTHLCQAACCRLIFALSKQDVQEGIIHWDFGQPYMIAQNEDGYCCHLDRHNLGCKVYEHRPLTCRAYDCRQDKRIWLDFENKIVNPDLARAGWPQCVELEEVQESKDGTPKNNPSSKN